ncbi:uncharacterized protein BO88DRAFT_488794 [Aspergillus vadensis CBS 113365]|uniref:Uncharacterized protein n=1 Tax=Aspergillus vadensis (strain CBS 113365 / IMI 142717 / IBT 24658) TaxID=1448311 RepID=A0A319B6A2_ASPVC|nr:hypothetical protein BO88DRAFT_488794 [Aspergillus vadensis CBS 113365]PYH68337.1 hypothetical protein BO88DRAFT_488794 [Aspergillus vadensis CBS 113365]
MTARDVVLLLVSVGRFGCFHNRAASRQECGKAFFESFTSLLSLSASLRDRYSFEDAVYLGRYRASLRDVMVCQTLCHFSSRMWFSYPQPLPSLRVRFILADIATSLRECGFYLTCSTSLRECGLQSLAGSLREFRLDFFSADRMNSSPPSVAIAPPPTPKFAISQPKIAYRFPSPS